MIEGVGEQPAFALLAPLDRDGPALFLEGAGLFPIPDDFEGWCWLFAHDRGVLRVEVNPARPPARALMPPLTRAKVRVWTHSPAEEPAIRDHIANLNLILNGLNPAGVVFDLHSLTIVPAEAWETIGHHCRNEAAVRRSPWFDGAAVNLYFHGVTDVAARCCLGGDMLFLGPRSPLGRLAHEAGHALGLRGDSDGSGLPYDDGHTDSLESDTPFCNANVMWRANSTLRAHLTLGQIAWMHGSERSVLPRLAGTLPHAKLPFWADDHPDRRPKREETDVETALAARYDRILAYWGGGRRPEGRPGSSSREDFIRLHKR